MGARGDDRSACRTNWTSVELWRYFTVRASSPLLSLEHGDLLSKQDYWRCLGLTLYETQNLTSLQQRGIIKWGSTRHQLLSENKIQVWWGEPGGFRWLLIKNLKPKNTKARYHNDYLGRKKVKSNFFYTFHTHTHTYTHLPVYLRRPVWTPAKAFQRWICVSFWMDEWCPAHMKHIKITINKTNLFWKRE